MTDANGLQLTYTPDYADTFSVQFQARRYHYSAVQRYVWWLLPVVQLGGVLPAVVVWDDPIRDTLEMFMPPSIAVWGPLAIFVIASVAMWLVVCRWLALRLSARWLAQRRAPVPVVFQDLPDRMLWASEDGERWIAWPRIERIFVTPTAVCFLVGDMTHFLPRRAFENAAALRDFLEAALSRLSDEARQASTTDKSVRAALAAGS
jgi:hypothetical protein